MGEIHWEEYYQKCLEGSLKPQDIDYPLDETLRNLAIVSQLPFLELKPEDIHENLLQTFSIYNAEKFSALPLKSEGAKICFASLNPFNPLMLHTLQNIFKTKRFFLFCVPTTLHLF